MQVTKHMFTLSGETPVARVASFTQAVASLYNAWPLGDIEAFDVSSVGHRVDDLVFSQASFSPVRVYRGPDQLMLPGSDFLVLEEHLEGREEIYLPMHKTWFAPGHIHLRDWSVGFEGISSGPRRLRSIVIPRDSLAGSGVMGVTNPMLSWSLTSPQGRMLKTLWDQIIAELDHVAQEDATELCQGLIGFLDTLMLRGEIIPESDATSAMQRYLDDNLHRSVGVHDLCDAFGVSRSTVYDRFRAFGGVDKYVLRSRLDKCYSALSNADPEHIRVGDVARQFGFEDSAVFSRRFRRQFGVPPSKVVGVGHRAARNASEGMNDGRPRQPTYSDWFDELAKNRRVTAADYN